MKHSDKLIDYSSKWIFELIEDFTKAGKNYYFVSDWNVDEDFVNYPKNLIDLSAENAKGGSLKYSFVEMQNELQFLIQFLLKNNDLNFETSSITVVGSATAALYATILSLHKINVSKFLVFTPIYYSILETLMDINADIYYFHLNDNDTFHIDFEVLLKVIDQHQIQAIIITDPLYSCGIGIPFDDIERLSLLCKEKDCWIINDSSLSGLFWNKAHQDIISIDKIKTISVTDKFIFIDSLSKKLLINGVKSALIIGRSDLIESIQTYINQFYGGFTSMQITLFKELYQPYNKTHIEGILNTNVRNIKNNFELLESTLRGSEYMAYPSNTGFFTIIAHKNLTMREIDSKAIIKQFLQQENVFALPSFYFCLNQDNKFGFRVNLLLNPHQSMPAIRKCISIDIKSFKK